MKSTTSFYNKGLVLSNLKRFWWVSALHTIYMFLLISLHFMTQNFEYLAQRKSAFNLFYEGTGAVSGIMLCVVPVGLAVLLFSYLHNIKSTTAIHGMPFTRTGLFINTTLSGIILLLIPYIINSAVIIIIKNIMPVGQYFTYAQLGIWFVNSMVIGILLFALAVFVGMFTGNMIAHFIFTYIAHFLPIILYALIGELFRLFLYGFKVEDYPAFFQNFPMIKACSNTLSLLPYYVIAAIILFALALLVYIKRPLEGATEIVVFKVMKYIFKYGVTFCTSLTGCIFISSLFNTNPNILVALLWALVGYFVSEMLINKTFRVFKSSYKGYLICALVILVFSGIMKYDLTGFETRVPEASKVESVNFLGFDYYVQSNAKISDPKFIESVTNLHKAIVSDIPKADGSHPYARSTGMDSTSLTIIYNLKNGASIRRYYSDLSISKLQAELAPVYESKERKIGSHPIFTLTPDEIKTMEINIEKVSEPTVITKKEDKKLLLDAIKKDMLNSTFAQYVSNRQQTLSFISILNYDRSENKYQIMDGKAVDISIPVYKDYTNTIKLINQMK